MRNLNHLIGVTISSKDISLKEKLEEIRRMQLGWIQVYIEPGTTEDHLNLLTSSGLEIAVHTAHESDNFLFARGDDRLNRQLFDETMQAARYLNSRMVIIHPGYLTKKVWNSDPEEQLAATRMFDTMTKYISESITGTNIQILVENLPRWSHNEMTIFHTAVNIFYDDMRKAKLGFCLDLASVAVNFNGFPDFVLDPPAAEVAFRFDSDRQILFGETLDVLAQDRLYELRIGHERHVRDFLHLKPQVMHLRGLHYGHVQRPKTTTATPMSDLNAVQLRVVIPYCMKRNAPLILECLDPQQQREDVLFINHQYQSMTNGG